MARLITPEAIASYPQLTQPDEKGKYGISLVFEGGFPKSLKQAALTALTNKYEGKLKGAKIVSLETPHGAANFLRTPGGLTLRLPWRDDPDVVANKGYPEGSAFINPRTSPGAPQPGVVSEVPDEDGKPMVIDPAKVYAGCIVKASIDPYCYDTDGNAGVTFGLGNVQFIRDGERLDGRTFAQDDFDVNEEAVADLSDLTDEDMTDDGEPVAVASDGSEAEEDDLSDLLG